MRFRKAVRKHNPQVTLTEDEIVQACYDYVRKQGLSPGNISWLRVPLKSTKVDSLGRKRRRGIEFLVEYTEAQNHT